MGLSAIREHRQRQELANGVCQVFMHFRHDDDWGTSTGRMIVEDVMRRLGADVNDFRLRDELIALAYRHLDIETAERNKAHLKLSPAVTGTQHA